MLNRAHILIFFTLLFLSGCASTPAFHKRTTITVEVNLVSDRSYFIDDYARSDRSGVAGYAYQDGVCKVWLLAKENEGKIYPEWWILGHEIQHCLNFQDKGIWNPDKYTWGMK